MTSGKYDNPETLAKELAAVPRLLLIRLRSLGDSILTLPLVEALKAWRPDLVLDVLIEAPFAPVFAGHPGVGETLVLRPKSSPDSAGLTRFGALRAIRRRRYPSVLNLHGGTTSMLFTLASGARIRIGQRQHRYNRACSALMPASSQVWGREKLHTAEHQLTLMRWLGLPMPDIPSGRLHLEAGAAERIRRRLGNAGIVSGFLLVHPTATLHTKRWPAANFARLADALAAEHGLPVVFTSGPGEAQVLVDAGAAARRPHLYWSDLALEELFALIGGCRLFVGNDSGPAHAAAALRKPVVVVWGSSSYSAWRPWNTEFEAVRSELPCMPCPGYECAVFGEPKCILEIPVEPVLEACRRLMARG